MRIRSALNFGVTTTRQHEVAAGDPGPKRGRRTAITGRQSAISPKTSLQAEFDCSSDNLGAWLAAEQSTPSEQAMRHELAVHVANALARIPDSQREALLLHYWQGCSLAEIAVQLNRTTDAVGGLLKRGLRHLRELLDTQN